MFPVSGDNLFAWKKNCFFNHSGHKKVAAIDDTDKTNHFMLLPSLLYLLTCGSCWLSCLGVCIALTPRLSRGYVDMHKINIDGTERKICCHCFDELWVGGKPEKLNKVLHSTVYRTE